MEQGDDFFLQFRREVDQQVAATEHVQFGERRVHDEVLGREHGHFADLLMDAVDAVFLREESAEAFRRHIAYDIGAAGVTRKLAARLKAPAVLSTFSRLLIDPNRGEDDPTLIRQIYDGAIIPANYPLYPAEKSKRTENYFRPFRHAVAAVAEFESRRSCA